jgi:hypothetical protein
MAGSTGARSGLPIPRRTIENLSSDCAGQEYANAIGARDRRASPTSGHRSEVSLNTVRVGGIDGTRTQILSATLATLTDQVIRGSEWSGNCTMGC